MGTFRRHPGTVYVLTRPERAVGYYVIFDGGLPRLSKTNIFSNVPVILYAPRMGVQPIENGMYKFILRRVRSNNLCVIRRDHWLGGK